MKPHNTSSVNASVRMHNDMLIYKLSVPPNSILIVNFTRLQFNNSLRILFKSLRRPTFYELSKELILISKPQEIRYSEKKPASTSIAYMAIAPCYNEVYNEIHFAFDVHTLSCNTWHRSSWTTLNCKVGPETSLTKIHCICKDFSIFSGKIYVTPNRLDLPRDLYLSSENIVLLSCAIFVILLYGVLMIWAWRKDKKDAKNLKICHIPDVPNETNSYVYHITLATGVYRHAGTSANVTISIHGSQENKEYTLFNRNTQYFQRGSENTFLIKTFAHLGRITSISMHHDSSGRYPSWYCEWVRIRDIQLQEDWIFNAQRWLSCVLGSTINITIPLMIEMEWNQRKRLIKRHIYTALTNNYLWFSLFVERPHSPFTRKERLTICMTSLVTSMISNIMFFGKTTEENVESEQIDHNHMPYRIQLVAIVIESVLLTFILNFILTFLFLRSKTAKKHPPVKYKIMFK